MLVVLAPGSGELGFPLRVCVDSHTSLFGSLNVNVGCARFFDWSLILVMHKSSLEFIISGDDRLACGCVWF